MGKEEIDFFRELGPTGRTLTPSTNIGVSSLPDQYVNLQLKKGFRFNIMCIGISGVGKSCLLNTLFRCPLIDLVHPTRSEEVTLVTQTLDMKEANVQLCVNFIESRGFGDQIDKTTSVKNVAKYIDDQFELYLKEESKIHRNLLTCTDSRVHACIYMIAPTGHSLSSLDIMTMKELQSRVNLIPVIGKSDILTAGELKDFKMRVRNDMIETGINWYKFPTDDPSTSSKNIEMNERIPLAVVGSMEEENINNQMYRVRKYPWGTVVIDDDNHCEFTHLREMILRANLFDLLRSTHEKFYEEFRSNKFITGGVSIDSELTDNVRRQCAEITESVERQMQELRFKFEKDMKDLEDGYRSSEFEMAQRFEASLKELEHKKSEVMASRKMSSSSLQKKDKKVKGKK